MCRQCEMCGEPLDRPAPAIYCSVCRGVCRGKVVNEAKPNGRSCHNPNCRVPLYDGYWYYCPACHEEIRRREQDQYEMPFAAEEM